jgi:hypothetical protein
VCVPWKQHEPEQSRGVRVHSDRQGILSSRATPENYSSVPRPTRLIASDDFAPSFPFPCWRFVWPLEPLAQYLTPYGSAASRSPLPRRNVMFVRLTTCSANGNDERPRVSYDREVSDGFQKLFPSVTDAYALTSTLAGFGK